VTTADGNIAHNRQDHVYTNAKKFPRRELRRPGRPSKLTPEIGGKLAGVIIAGHSISDAWPKSGRDPQRATLACTCPLDTPGGSGLPPLVVYQ
jgi:hypothetical protein